MYAGEDLNDEHGDAGGMWILKVTVRAHAPHIWIARRFELSPP
jgi:hypothetical protein